MNTIHHREAPSRAQSRPNLTHLPHQTERVWQAKKPNDVNRVSYLTHLPHLPFRDWWRKEGGGINVPLRELVCRVWREWHRSEILTELRDTLGVAGVVGVRHAVAVVVPC